jgi:transposase
MLQMPTHEEEDRRRISRERKTLTNERVSHVNRIKGLLLSQGISDYQPLRRERHKQLEELRTGDGRPLPAHMKAQVGSELDRLELLLEQIRAVEVERDAMLAAAPVGPAQCADVAPAMLLALKGIGEEFAAVLMVRGTVCLVILTIDDKLLPMLALRRHPGRVARSTASRVSPKPAIQGCEPC